MENKVTKTYKYSGHLFCTSFHLRSVTFFSLSWIIFYRKQPLGAPGWCSLFIHSCVRSFFPCSFVFLVCRGFLVAFSYISSLVRCSHVFVSLCRLHVTACKDLMFPFSLVRFSSTSLRGDNIAELVMAAQWSWSQCNASSQTLFLDVN